MQLLVIQNSKLLTSCAETRDNGVLHASVAVAFVLAIFSLLISVHDFFNRQMAFLVIVASRFHKSTAPRIEQQDPFIVDETGIIMAVTNPYLREWWLDGVKFLGNNDDWHQAAEIFQAVYDGKKTNDIREVRLDGIMNVTFLKAHIFLGLLGDDNKILSTWRDIRSNIFYKAIVKGNFTNVKVMSVGVEVWPQMELHNQLMHQFRDNQQLFLEVSHMGVPKAVKKVQDAGQDDEKRERHVSVNQKFKLVEINTKSKASKDMKYTQVMLTRVSPDNEYFIIRLVRNLNQCIHVDFSEKRKKHHEGDMSDEEEGDDGFNMAMFQGGGDGAKSKEDEDDIMPHKIQQLKYHIVIG